MKLAGLGTAFFDVSLGLESSKAFKMTNYDPELRLFTRKSLNSIEVMDLTVVESRGEKKHRTKLRKARK